MAMKIRAPAFFANIAYFGCKGVLSTMKIKTYYHPDIKNLDQCIYCFWHGRQILPITLMHKHGSKHHAALVSNSQDGQIIANWLQKFGHTVIRGSSSKKGISGMKQLLKVAQNGYSIGIAADGPRGPRYAVKPGTGFLAYKTGLPIIPLASCFSHAKKFTRSWDHFEVPMPFSKAVFYFGQPIYLKDKSQIDAFNEKLNHHLMCADEKAKLILNSRDVPEDVVTHLPS